MTTDGRYFVFQTADWGNLVAEDTNGVTDVYVLDRATMSLRLVTHSSVGIVANDHSYVTNGGITANGAFVIFDTFASNLGSPDVNAMRTVTSPVSMHIRWCACRRVLPGSNPMQTFRA
jgi:hypothetical protein